MSAMRFLAIIAITFAAVQIAAADDKKTTKKPSSGQTIEVEDYGFGVNMPTTILRRKRTAARIQRHPRRGAPESQEASTSPHLVAKW
jgi:hypothetical protein